jgi:hypothetical protein
MKKRDGSGKVMFLLGRNISTVVFVRRRRRNRVGRRHPLIQSGGSAHHMRVYSHSLAGS